MKFSQSLLDKADSCLLSMQFAVESPLYYGGIVRAVGTAYHAGLEERYRSSQQFPHDPSDLATCFERAREALRREIEEAGDEFIWDEKFPTVEDAEHCIEAMLTWYFTHDEADGPIPWPTDWEVVDVEVAWELPYSGPLGDVMITSRGIDLVLRDPNGWIVGVDHKTAGKMWDGFKHHPRKKAQGPLYVWAMQQLYPDAPGYRFVYDIMRYPSKTTGECKFERRIADPDPAQVQAALERVGRHAWLYEKVRGAGVDMPANPASTLCSKRYCDYWSTCPFGEALDTSLS